MHLTYLEARDGSRGGVLAPGYLLDVREMSRECCVLKTKQDNIGGRVVLAARALGPWESRAKPSSSPWHDSPETSPLIGVWLPQWLGLFFSHSSGYWSYWSGLGQKLQGIQFPPNKGITDSGLLSKA